MSAKLKKVLSGVVSCVAVGLVVWSFLSSPPSGEHGSYDPSGIVALSDGTFAIAGINHRQSKGDHSTNLFIGRFDARGQRQWFNVIGKRRADESAYSVIAYPDDSLLISGQFDEEITFGRGSPNERRA